MDRQSVDHPNVLWIYCDELRSDALRCYGNPHATIVTPHVDGLAESGAMFTEFYVNSPVCVPSRLSTLTGMPPERTGVYHNEATWEPYPSVPSWRTLPQQLAEHGYATRNFGKEHLPAGMQPWQVDLRDGAHMRAPLGAVPEDELRVVRTPPPLHSIVAGAYPADLPFPPEQVTENAVEAISSTAEPFLIRASYLQPHTPVIAPEPWASRYDDVAFPDSPVRNSELSQFEQKFAEIYGGLEMTPDDVRRAQACYYGLVGWVDAQVGRLLSALEDRGLSERTIVVFTTEHGCYLGEDGGYGKQTFAPQSHRVPFIVSWPGTLPGGQRRTDLCQGLDLGRTLLGMCGVRVPEQFEGRNLFTEAAPDEVFATIGYGAVGSRAFSNRAEGTFGDGQSWPRRSCVRTRDFRLDMNTRIDGRLPVSDDERDAFFVDRRADPGESRNMADDPAYRAIVDDLTRRLLDHGNRSVEPPTDAVYQWRDAGSRWAPPGTYR